MSWFDSVSQKKPSADWPKPSFNPEQASLAQLGAMSPLWLLFLGATSAGMAYWGMTRWMRLATPERVAGAVVKLRLVKPEPTPEPVADIKVEPGPEPEPAPPVVAEAPAPVIEAPAPPVVAEAAPPPVTMAPAPISLRAVERR